jgi:hypothetical protein
MQKLPEALRTRIANEFRFAANRMADTPDLAAKLYFFSAFFGELNRAFNQSWSPELGVAYSVLKDVHQQISGRVGMPTPGTGIPAGLPGALDWVANELAGLFESEQVDDAQLYQALARAAELGYVATGNGYYLYLKGQITI